MSWRLQGQSRIMTHDEIIEKLIFSEVIFVDGKPKTDIQETIRIPANVQPMDGRDLLLVPEHERFLEQYLCYVPMSHPIKTGDVVRRKNINYQVQNVESWGSFQQVRIMRADVGKLAHDLSHP